MCHTVAFLSWYITFLRKFYKFVWTLSVLITGLVPRRLLCNDLWNVIFVKFIIWSGFVQIQGLESPVKRHRSWTNLKKSWNSIFWFKYHSLEKKFIVIHCVHFVTSWVSSDFRKTFMLLLKLVWYVHFLTRCNHVCEPNVSWKVLEKAFFESWRNWSLICASPWKLL